MSASSRIAILFTLGSISAAQPAKADDFGALPKSLVSPQEAPSPPTIFQHTDFGELLRNVAPVGKAEAAAPNLPSSALDKPRPEPPSPGQAEPTEQENGTAAYAIQPSNVVPPARAIDRGLAAWYQHSGKTASGEPYDPNGLTAAHGTLPFGATVRVISEKTGKEVVLRITDRISQKAMRRHYLAIELSRGAAQAIGLDGIGTVSIYEAN